MFKIDTLSNGLRIIRVPMKNTKAVTVLVLVAAGSKYEDKRTNGISHFLEHMFFKGTEKRVTPLDVSETLDKIGGRYNAFTGEEFTGYWAKVDARHQGVALDWVSDIFLNSCMPAEEIKKEKGVIIEEMNMYLDTPLLYIEDVWKKLLYGDQPAGWPIIGSKKNVLSFEKKDFLNYLAKHYTASKTVVVLAGNIKREALKDVKKYFRGIRKGPVRKKRKVIEKQNKPKSLIEYKRTDQTHLSLGVRGYSLFQKERYAQTLLAIILGGNMSSRLFTKIRGERGLAYYIRTTDESFSDSGYLTSQAGVPHKNLGEVIKLILEEYKRVKKEGIKEEELQKAKDYLKGTTVLSMESSDAQASFYGSQALLLNKVLSLEEKFKQINKVKKKDIESIAQEIFRAQGLNLALIGPHNNRSKINTLLKI
jgi:predicted Zn-dependent peptidase